MTHDIETKWISLEEAYPLFFSDGSWELNKMDGYTFKNFIEGHEQYKYIGTYKDKELLGVTAVLQGTPTEVHTYIHPEHRREAPLIHKNQFKFMNDQGSEKFVTYVDSGNRGAINYLVNRHGFRVTESLGEIKRNGIPHTSYKLERG